MTVVVKSAMTVTFLTTMTATITAKVTTAI